MTPDACMWEAAADDFCTDDAIPGESYCARHHPESEWLDPDALIDCEKEDWS